MARPGDRVPLPGNRGSRGLESVIPGLRRLKNRVTGFLLEKWENAGQAGSQLPPPLLGQTWGWAWESALVSSPQVTPLWTEARGPPRTVPSRSCGQPAHSSAACGFSTLPLASVLHKIKTGPSCLPCLPLWCSAICSPLHSLRARPRLPSTHVHGLLPAPGLIVHTGPLEPEDVGPTYDCDFKQFVFLVFASVP